MTPTDTNFARWTRHATWPDVVGFAVAAVLGSVSLEYPFCRDQGLFQYVGRQWFLEGQLPYRDVFDHKTPFIFFVNGIFVRLFGEGILPVRVSELLLVLSIGPLALLANRSAPRSGVLGLTTLAAISFYFGYLPYPDTGNCEVWAVVMLLGALVAVKRGRGARSIALAGLLCGLAFLAKPPAALFVGAIGCVLLLTRSTLNERVRSGALLVGTFLVPIVLTLAYFAAKGGLFHLYDVVVNLNRYYVTSEGVVHTGFDALRALLDGVLFFGPFGTLFFIVSGTLTVLGVSSGRTALALRYAEPLVYGVLALGVVWMQRKFFAYHYTFLVFGFVIFALRAIEDIFALLGARAGERIPAAALGVALLLLQHTGGAPVREYERRAGDLADYLMGKIDRETYERRFDIPGFYDNGNVLLVSRWLAEHTKPTEHVLVRGYEPEIYLLSKRSFGGRFFWSVFLTTTWRSYRREEWLAEDRAELDHIRPEWVVALPPQTVPPRDDWFIARNELESANWFEARGYVLAARFGAFSILRRSEGTTSH